MNIPESNSLAIARPGPAPAPQHLDLFGGLRRHLFLSFFLLLVIGAAGGWLAYQRNVVTYSSYAEVHVARNFQRTLEMDREMEMRTTREYDIFRNEQIGLLFRPEVLEDGLRRAGQLENGVWADPEFGPEGAVARFAAALDVELLRDTYRIAITLTALDPEILKPALDGLLAAFLDAHRLEYSFEQDERPLILRESLAELDESIAIKRQALTTLAEKLNVLDFNDRRSNPWVTPLENARIALVEAQRNVNNLRLELEALNVEDTAGVELDIVLLGGGDSVSPGLATIVGPLVERRLTAISLLQAVNPTHPAHAGLKQDVESLEQQIADLLVSHTRASRLTYESDMKRASLRVEQLTSEVEQLGSKARGFVSSFQDGVVVQALLQDDLKRRGQIVERLNFFEIETKSPSYLHVVLPATAVDLAGENKLMRNLLLAALFAAMVAFGIPFLLDLTDKRIHTTQDIESVFGFPPAIWIPEPKRGAQMHLAQDQIRRFALALDRDQAYARARLIQFSEVKASKGAQQVVDDIATALTGVGRKILVVDAIAPRHHQSAKTITTVGFLGLLAGKELEVISRENGDFLEYGNPLTEKGQVFSGWENILREAAKDYDMVLIRADPLLDSAEAEHMASSVDLVVLMVEAGKQTRGELQRAGDVLASLHPAAVGTLMHNAKIYRNHGYYRELLKARRALPPSS